MTSWRVGPAAVAAVSVPIVTTVSSRGSANVKIAGLTRSTATIPTIARAPQPMSARRIGTGSSIGGARRMELDERRAGAVVEQRPGVALAPRVDPPPHQRGMAVEPERWSEPAHEPAERGEATVREVGVVVDPPRRGVADDEERPPAQRSGPRE